MRPGRKYTRHRLSDYQVAMLSRINRGEAVYVGRTYASLICKALMDPTGIVTTGKLCRAVITPEGAQALRDAQDAGWTP